MTYAFLIDGRTSDQIKELDEILENPAMTDEEKANRANARQYQKVGADWARLDGPKPKPLRPRQRPLEES